MGEIKSVKVDNWGVFFLQKLQNFFNKTDYCDLTLQFNDNSQLKVHRLVLSACTDYFNVLEQTCEVVDDALIMPNELQADVVVPIVNFMYTGTLEFELKMYGKLLRTAKEMNMTVLLKLLEAHRRTMEGVNRTQCAANPKSGVRKRGPISVPTGTTTTAPMAAQVRSSSNSTQVPQQRRLLPTTTASTTRRVVQTKSIATNVTTQSQQYRQQVATTSLLKVSPTASTSPNKSQRPTYDESKSNEIGSVVSSYDSSIQFKEEQQDDYDHPSTSSTVNQSTSPFEQLRKGYNNNKRPTSTTFISPPAKKPNIEDVKEFAEQQRVRKQIAAEYGEDQEYESTMLDDDIHNYDDDDDIAALTPLTTPTITSSSTTTETTLNTIGAGSGPPIRQQSSQSSIIIKQEPNEKPTIVVKDSSNSKMNHAKIISEVLRQYPHLVKSNKSIKLKIMPNIGGQSQKIIVKKEHIENIKEEVNIQTATASNAGHNQPPSKPIQQQAEQQQKVQKPSQQPQQALLKLSEKPLPTQQTISSQKNTAMSSTTSSTTNAVHDTSKIASQPQKRRIDSKTMHALIALGAENTTGPWLCLRCGVNGRPISIPSYRGFRRHLVNTHKEAIDEALCEHCGWRSTTNRELHYHIHVEHKIKTTLYTFPECLMCAEIFIDTNALNQHMIESHPDENQQQCIYCNKIFAKEIQLFTHMKTYHKKQAIDDGIIDYSEDEDGGGGIDDDDDNAIEDNDDAENESEAEAMDTIEERTLSNVCVERKQNPSSSSSSANASNKKIKILSDISLPSTGSLIKLDSGRESESGINFQSSKGLTNAGHGNSSNIDDAEIAKEPKFVSADGNEMMLTDEQRKEIMSQLNQEHEGGVVMVLNESAFADGVETLSNTNEQASLDHRIPEQVGSNEHLEDSNAGQHVEGEEEDDDDEEEYIDENNMYRDFVRKNDEAEVKETSPSVLDESKGSMENLEWAENIITAHELEEEKQQHQEASKTNTKEIEINKPTDSLQDHRKHEDISQKLKELTGDWSDDEIDDAIDEVMVKPTVKFCKDIKVEDERAEIEEAPISSVETEEEKKETNEDETERAEKETNILNESNEIEMNVEKEPEDDIEMALKSLHKEEEDDEDEEEEEQQEEFIAQLKNSSDEGANNATVLTSTNEVEDVKMHEDEMNESAINSFKDPLGAVESDAVEKRDHQASMDEIVKSEKNEECIIKREKEGNDEEESKAKVIEALLDDKEDKEKCTLEKLCSDTKKETEASADCAVEETERIMEVTAKIEDSIGDAEKKEITNEPVDCVTKSKTTEETIKTLMSEWVEDDDDEVMETIE